MPLHESGAAERELAQSLPVELLDYVHHGREERNLEYKERLDWDRPQHRAKVVKAVLGMSNLRDGGVLVIGVRDDGTAVGLAHEDAKKFTQDAIAAAVSKHAVPYAEPTVTIGHHPEETSRWFAVIQIAAFEEVPVLCGKAGYGLRQGAMYTRGRRIFETSEVKGESEMREILDMAVVKGIRAFYRRVAAAGLDVSPNVEHRKRFEDQLEGL